MTPFAPVALTATEFQLLEVLACNRTRAVHKGQLLSQVWDTTPTTTC